MDTYLTLYLVLIKWWTLYFTDDIFSHRASMFQAQLTKRVYNAIIDNVIPILQFNRQRTTMESNASDSRDSFYELLQEVIALGETNDFDTEDEMDVDAPPPPSTPSVLPVQKVVQTETTTEPKSPRNCGPPKRFRDHYFL